jgi:hypothetical protein
LVGWIDGYVVVQTQTEANKNNQEVLNIPEQTDRSRPHMGLHEDDGYHD